MKQISNCSWSSWLVPGYTILIVRMSTANFVASCDCHVVGSYMLRL
uniref:Uncharacterized protein n=1 Tax=Rhizophora mucronata TaxID=61149 RepID=A0A2P2KAJ5_RHIMU